MFGLAEAVAEEVQVQHIEPREKQKCACPGPASVAFSSSVNYRTPSLMDESSR